TSGARRPSRWSANGSTASRPATLTAKQRSRSSRPPSQNTTQGHSPCGVCLDRLRCGLAEQTNNDRHESLWRLLVQPTGRRGLSKQTNYDRHPEVLHSAASRVKPRRTTAPTGQQSQLRFKARGPFPSSYESAL